MDAQDGVLSFEQVAPFSSADQACFDDIREVLAKHNALNRFGICLLHSHFDMADDEILVETVDSAKRTMVLRPMKQVEVPDALETAWQFSTTGLAAVAAGDPEIMPMPIPIPKQKCIRGCTWEELPDGRRQHYQTHKWNDDPSGN